MSTQAQEILDEQVRGWGERSLYNVTPDELQTLKSAGATHVEVNKDNTDGTFYNEVLWNGKRFACSSTTKI
jgi:hypothetical protein